MTTIPDFKYNASQISQYYNRISVAPEHHLPTVKDLSATSQLAHLSRLHKHHSVKIPWENVDQHYTHHRTLTVRPNSLFRKIIAPASSSARGGYCMENNTVIHFLLHSLGFTTYLTGARVALPGAGTFTGTFTGWSHCVNIVVIGGTPYMVDIGFGVRGAITPIALDGDGVVYAHIAPAQSRVVREPLPGSLSGQKFWMYQWRRDVDAEWVTQYCFTEVEFTLPDLQGMNLEPMTSRTTFFNWKMVCVRCTVAGEDEGETSEKRMPGSPGVDVLGEGEIDGTLSMEHDVLKWRRHGKKVLEIKFKNEKERVMALEKYFGIVVEQEDWEAVLGSAAAVKNQMEFVG